jgi:hypothetical protein
MFSAKAPVDCSIADSTQFHLRLSLRSSAIRGLTRSRPAYWMETYVGKEYSRLSDLSTGGNIPLIDNLLPGNNEDAVMQIDARADVVRNDPELVPYFYL